MESLDLENIDLTVSGYSINVQQNDILIDAVEAAARTKHPEDFVAIDAHEEEEQEETVNQQENIEPEDATLTPPAPCTLAAQPLTAPVPVVEEITPILSNESTSPVTPVTTEIQPETAPVTAVQVEAVVVPSKKATRAMKGKASRIKSTRTSTGGTKSNRRDTFSSSTTAASKTKMKTKMKTKTKTKTTSKMKTKTTTTSTARGRAKERTKKPTHRRASSGSAAFSNGTPSYLRPTRSSSLSQERALKRKQDRQSLSESRSLKTGFGGHTYKNKRQKSRALTEPKAFRLSTSVRNRQAEKSLTSEEQEVVNAQKAQKQMEKRRKKNELSRHRSTNSSTTFSTSSSSFTSTSSTAVAAAATATAATATATISTNTLTEPKAFSLSKSTRSRQSLTSEELQMQRAKAEKEQTRQKREKSKRNMLFSATNKHRTSRSIKKLTEASSPKLNTRTRPKAGLTQRKKEAQKKKNNSKSKFSTSLRSRPTASGHGPVKAVMKQQKSTKPMTPNFATTKRAKQYKETHRSQQSGGDEEEANSPIVSLAEQVMKINNKIPDRFHSKSKHHKPKKSLSFEHKKLTDPKAPSFATDKRAATHPKVKSTEEREMEIVDQYNGVDKFKANPVDPRVMNSAGDLGVPRLPKKKLTECNSPTFRVDKRASVERSAMMSVEKETFKPFKAREIGEGVVQGFSGTSSYSGPKPTTECVPFSLSSSRVRENENKNNESPQYKPFKARPAPIHTTGSNATSHLNNLQTKELTKPMTPPLAGLKRHKEAQLAQAAKIKAEREAEAKLSSSFRARDIGQDVPVPVYNSSFQPRELTQVTPFNISSDPSGQKERRENRLRQEQMEMDKARTFKARPIPKTHNEKHKFALNNTVKKPLTEVKNMVLSSDIRAQERALYEKQAGLRRAQEEREKDQKRLQLEAETNAEIDADMEALQFHSTKSTAQVHKFLHTAPIAIKHSEAALVTPQSPMLLTSSRVRSTE